jgi:hypothetical protein
VLCGQHPDRTWETLGIIVGAVINQTNITVTDLEIELSIITRDTKGLVKRGHDARFVGVPYLNQTGMVTKLEPNGDVYFSIPETWWQEGICPREWDSGSVVLNVAAIAITRINGKSILPAGANGKPLKLAPLESMLQVPREAPQHAPTQRGMIAAVREKNALLQSTIINNQLQDCLSRGTWACTFNNDTNINVVISQK